MLKLYGGKFSRASIVQWYLDELNLPYEYILLDMQAGEHRQADFLAINPMGKVPAIVDGEATLWESGAILLYIAEKQGQLPESLPDRARVWQWVLFANSTLATGLFVEANRDREFPKLIAPLEEIFDRQSYILGEEFSVADVAIGSILSFSTIMLDLDYQEYPAVAGYIDRIKSRSAYQKAIGSR